MLSCREVCRVELSLFECVLVSIGSVMLYIYINTWFFIYFDINMYYFLTEVNLGILSPPSKYFSLNYTVRRYNMIIENEGRLGWSHWSLQWPGWSNWRLLSEIFNQAKTWARFEYFYIIRYILGGLHFNCQILRRLLSSSFTNVQCVDRARWVCLFSAS